MKRELKDKKIVIRVTETQFKKLAEGILEEDKSISQFIREAIREKLK
ncbi:Ribbon-helix-helix protein, copG family [Belliella buryatensis]|uniref:Ribbon-helix-helix protein, copG family n=1 Tax=Belliella buryatensis TaxID=1500549 RepID=A0A239FLQ0_9BACT|nr:ribbon-helix-helix protein, CopG family [Belliella buryatensis]SNS57800.1 Ribbon-helix-helix protein, copG family [Belliella buryatensis]